MNPHTAFILFISAIALVALAAVLAGIKLARRREQKAKHQTDANLNQADTTPEDLEAVTKQLIEELAVSHSTGAKITIMTKIYQHLDGIDLALEFLSPTGASGLLRRYSGLKGRHTAVDTATMQGRLIAARLTLREAIESVKSQDPTALAQAAVQELLTKQGAEIDSFVARTELHLTNIEKARAAPEGAPRLESAINMARALLASAAMFRSKWSDQVARLKGQYPQIQAWQTAASLAQLESLPEGMVKPEQLLKQALGLAGETQQCEPVCIPIPGSAD